MNNEDILIEFTRILQIFAGQLGQIDNGHPARAGAKLGFIQLYQFHRGRRNEIWREVQGC